MTNPPVIHLAERRKAPAASAKIAGKAQDRQSAIISLCVKYCQLLASYDAGFDADPTGDNEFAGTGRQTFRARRILMKLVALNPHQSNGADPITENEARAMTAVLRSLYGLRNGRICFRRKRRSLRFSRAALPIISATAPAIGLRRSAVLRLVIEELAAFAALSCFILMFSVWSAIACGA